jgi:hypothetical protein
VVPGLWYLLQDFVPSSSNVLNMRKLEEIRFPRRQPQWLEQFGDELCVSILSRRRGQNWDRIGKMRLQRKVKTRNVKATDTAGNEFESRWLKRLGLPSAWREPARKHLEQLCFSVPQDTWPLIESLFTVVPQILNREPERMDLAEAYGWCCYAFWQCESAFPSFPERFASFLLNQLQAGECRNLEISCLLASLFVDADDLEKWGGINHPQLARPEVIRAHESVVKHGEYERILKAQIKYDEFERQIRASADLKKEWTEIKRLFLDQTTGRDIIHRSLVPERIHPGLYQLRSEARSETRDCLRVTPSARNPTPGRRIFGRSH